MISSSMIIMIGVIIIIMIIGSGNDRFVEVPPQRIHQVTRSWCGRTEKYHNQKKKQPIPFPRPYLKYRHVLAILFGLRKMVDTQGHVISRNFIGHAGHHHHNRLCSLPSSFTALKYDFEKSLVSLVMLWLLWKIWWTCVHCKKIKFRYSSEQSPQDLYIGMSGAT